MRTKAATGTGSSGRRPADASMGGDGVGGRTRIADVVVESIAGIATKEAPGVYSMGGGMSRAMGAVRDRIQSGEDSTRGVHAEVGEKQTAIDLDFVAEYGLPISETVRQVRSNVTEAVTRMTGLEVVEVNVDVVDVHVADDSADSDSDRGTDSDRDQRRSSQEAGAASAGRSRVE